MKLLPVLGLILFLVGRTFSLQAFPTSEGGGEGPEHQQRADAREEQTTQDSEQEEARRRLSESGSSSTTETVGRMDSMNNSSSSAAATTTAVVAGGATEEAAVTAIEDSTGSLGEHSVADVSKQTRRLYRLGLDGNWEQSKTLRQEHGSLLIDLKIRQLHGKVQV